MRSQLIINIPPNPYKLMVSLDILFLLHKIIFTQVIYFWHQFSSNIILLFAGLWLTVNGSSALF